MLQHESNSKIYLDFFFITKLNVIEEKSLRRAEQPRKISQKSERKADE